MFEEDIVSREAIADVEVCMDTMCPPSTNSRGGGQPQADDIILLAIRRL